MTTNQKLRITVGRISGAWSFCLDAEIKENEINMRKDIDG